MATLWHSIILAYVTELLRPWAPFQLTHWSRAQRGSQTPLDAEVLGHPGCSLCFATRSWVSNARAVVISFWRYAAVSFHTEVTSNFTQRVDFPAKKSKNRADLRAKWTSTNTSQLQPSGFFFSCSTAGPSALAGCWSEQQSWRQKWWKRWRAVDFVKCYPGACQSRMQRRDS